MQDFGDVRAGQAGLEEVLGGLAGASRGLSLYAFEVVHGRAG